MSSTTYTPVAAKAAEARAKKAGLPALRAGAETASRSGIWVGLFTITMSFAAFTSALFVREGAGDWQHLIVPNILYLNTVAILLSSACLYMANEAISTVAPDARELRRGKQWLMGTMALGLVFVAGQYEAWRQLAGQGLYLATNPNSSFFYVLTGVHALHVLGGLAALTYVIARVATGRGLRRTTMGNVAIYWHFMGVLWVYLLIVLRTKL